jgi:hypothetical protein
MPSSELGNIPRYAMFQGKRVRIVGYEKVAYTDNDRRFHILLGDDTTRTVRRTDLTFLPERKRAK